MKYVLPRAFGLPAFPLKGVTMPRRWMISLGLVVVCVGFGLVARLVPHPPNFARSRRSPCSLVF